MISLMWTIVFAVTAFLGLWLDRRNRMLWLCVGLFSIVLIGVTLGRI